MLALISALLFFLFSFTLTAQELLFEQPISMTNVNLRDSIVTLARIDAFIPVAGNVVLRFDGVCYSSPGDQIILAANNAAFWQVDYGNVSVETADENIGKSFSHTHTLYYYEADAGKTHSFYAVARNWVKQNGSGYAGIYGLLSAEFLPYTGTAFVTSIGNTFNGDVTNPTVAATASVYASAEGKVIVRFDGWCMSDIGDRIVLAASNTTNWFPDDGNVSVEATSASIDVNAFSHTREYEVSEVGNQPFYGVVQNYGETDGNGMVWVYSNLNAEFYANSGSTLVAFQGFSQPGVDLNDHFVILTSVSLDAPGPGKVLVDLDGDMTSDPGDFIELGASDGLTLPENDGNVTLQAVDDDLNRNCFAHSRVYSVNAGHHTFYALGKSFSNNPGSGIANIYGELLARYFPDQSTAVHDVATSTDELKVFPDPTTGPITVSGMSDAFGDKTIRLLDETGCLLSTYEIDDETDLTIDLSSLPDGMYLLASGNIVKRVIKIN